MTSSPRRSPMPAQCRHQQGHQHGTRACYIHDGCGCQPCVAANTRYAHEREGAIAFGRWESPYVPAGTTRATLLQMRLAGMTRPQMIAATGLGKGSIEVLLRRKAGAYTAQRVRRETAEKVAAARVVQGEGYAPAVGVKRRLQAVARSRGWSLSAIAPHAEVSASTLSNALALPRVAGVTRAAILDVYEFLLATDPPSNGRSARASVTATMRRAEMFGWAPDAAWDNIDDPDEVPKGVPLPTDVRTRADIVEDIEYLVSTGAVWVTIEQRLGRERDGLVQLLKKEGRVDLRQRVDVASYGFALGNAA